MKKEFFEGNRKRFYESMKNNSLAVFFSGAEIRKSNDEYYPFFANRNFFYRQDSRRKTLFYWQEKIV